MTLQSLVVGVVGTVVLVVTFLYLKHKAAQSRARGDVLRDD